MDIQTFTTPKDQVVGLELHFGQAEAEFVLESDGSIIYTPYNDDKKWFAAPTLEIFQKAAVSWSRYCKEVQKYSTEEEQLSVVAHLHNELSKLGLVGAGIETVWSSYVEQAKYGHL